MDLIAGSSSHAPDAIIVRDPDRDAPVRVKILIEQPERPGPVWIAAFRLRLLRSEREVVVNELTHLDEEGGDTPGRPTVAGGQHSEW